MLNTLAYGTNITGWIIIAVVVVLLFGSQRIPEMMKGLGSGLKEFKKGMKEDEEPAKEPTEEKK